MNRDGYDRRAARERTHYGADNPRVEMTPLRNLVLVNGRAYTEQLWRNEDGREIVVLRPARKKLAKGGR
jgi:hypothetical protein